jgi:cell division protein FtsW (lipid II flippase)
LSSAGVAVGAKDFGDSYYFVKKQIFLGLIPGIVGFLFMVNINYIHWKKYSLIYIY